LGYEKPQSGYALCGVFLRHISARRNACALLYRRAKTSYTAGTLNEIFLPKFVVAGAIHGARNFYINPQKKTLQKIFLWIEL
jgi:hypothetical protein